MKRIIGIILAVLVSVAFIFGGVLFLNTVYENFVISLIVMLGILSGLGIYGLLMWFIITLILE